MLAFFFVGSPIIWKLYTTASFQLHQQLFLGPGRWWPPNYLAQHKICIYLGCWSLEIYPALAFFFLGPLKIGNLSTSACFKLHHLLFWRARRVVPSQLLGSTTKNLYLFRLLKFRNPSSGSKVSLFLFWPQNNFNELHPCIKF